MLTLSDLNCALYTSLPDEITTFSSCIEFHNSIYSVQQLTVETYGMAVSSLSQVVKMTENTTEQNSEVLGTVANYFNQLATFVNESNVTINTTVSHKLQSLQSP